MKHVTTAPYKWLIQNIYQDVKHVYVIRSSSATTRMLALVRNYDKNYCKCWPC